MPKTDKRNLVFDKRFQEILDVEQQVLQDADTVAKQYMKGNKYYINAVDSWQHCVCEDNTESYDKFRNALKDNIPPFTPKMLRKSTPILCGNRKPLELDTVGEMLARMTISSEYVVPYLHRLAECDWSKSTDKNLHLLIYSAVWIASHRLHDIDLRLASTALVALYNAYATTERQHGESWTDTHSRLLNSDKFDAVWMKLYLTNGHRHLVK